MNLINLAGFRGVGEAEVYAFMVKFSTELLKFTSLSLPNLVLCAILFS